MTQSFSVTAANAPKSASLRVFLPINNQQTVPLEGQSVLVATVFAELWITHPNRPSTIERARRFR
jgi:hypothetical protein